MRQCVLGGGRGSTFLTGVGVCNFPVAGQGPESLTHNTACLVILFSVLTFCGWQWEGAARGILELFCKFTWNCLPWECVFTHFLPLIHPNKVKNPVPFFFLSFFFLSCQEFTTPTCLETIKQKTSDPFNSSQREKWSAYFLMNKISSHVVLLSVVSAFFENQPIGLKFFHIWGTIATITLPIIVTVPYTYVYLL